MKFKPHRRMDDRGKTDRRRSARWETSKQLLWRVFRGRRIREGRLVERSLDGLVLSAEPCDRPRVGTRLLPGNTDVANRLGFRSAIVKRIDVPGGGTSLIFAEIEA